MPALDPLMLSVAFAMINLWTFMLFGFDKLRAEAGRWRISESTLIFWASIGGTIGAYAGRSHFRHKTRKLSFTNKLHATAFVQAVALSLIAGYSLAS